MYETPLEVTDVCDTSMCVGEQKRVTHKYRFNGEECSIHKDACCVVNREWYGWTWYCYRCQEKGFVSENFLSPDHTVKKIIDMVENKKTKFKVITKVSLPPDFVPIKVFTRTPVVPPEATTWLANVGILSTQCEAFNVGWSELYQRVIIPIYEYNAPGLKSARKLIGWCGRYVGKDKTDKRTGKLIPKYLTKKDTDINRVFFHAPAFNHSFANEWRKDVVIYVEDVLSAMKVNAATGMSCYALLNTSLPDDMVRAHNQDMQLLWLDFDQGAKMAKVVTRYKAWNMIMSMVWTTNDPKFYCGIEIRKEISDRLAILNKKK